MTTITPVQACKLVDAAFQRCHHTAPNNRIMVEFTEAELAQIQLAIAAQNTKPTILVVAANGYWGRGETLAKAKSLAYCKRGVPYTAYTSTDPTVEFGGAQIISEPGTVTTLLGSFVSRGLKWTDDKEI